MKKAWWAIGVIIILLTVGLIVGVQYVTNQDTTQPQDITTTTSLTQSAPSDKPDEITVGTQTIASTLFIQSAYAKNSSYIAIHVLGVKGQPGRPIGQSEMFSGDKTNIPIKLQWKISPNQLLFAVLYKDGDAIVPKAYDPAIDAVDRLKDNIIQPFFVSPPVASPTALPQ